MTYNEFIETFNAVFDCHSGHERGISLSDRQKEQLRQAEALYREWNSRINVISRKDIDKLYLHHILHSLAIAYYAQTHLNEDFAGAKILDLGTGGGFPGIPLAILFPDAEFTLCDSVGKKTIVAGEVAKGLGLENVRVVNARAESLPETYDYIVSRAVTSLDNFMPWVKGKYSRGILYLKGGDLAEEITTAMAKNRMKKGSVHTWPISSVFKDEFFSEKLVIFIENICK